MNDWEIGMLSLLGARKKKVKRKLYSVKSLSEIERAIEELGEATSEKIAEHMGVDIKYVKNRMAQLGKHQPKLKFKKSWNERVYRIE
jgi:transcription initiation factor IIE alpha subunit